VGSVRPARLYPPTSRRGAAVTYPQIWLRVWSSAPENGHHFDMSSNLGQIIQANGGYFKRSEALRCGEDDRTLRAALRDGTIVRLRHGIYAPSELLPVGDELARHVFLARAAVAGQRGTVALTGPSAAALHGFSLYGHDLSIVHLLRLDRGSGRREAGIDHHIATRFADDSIGEYHGLLAVTPARAVWEVGRMSTLEGGVVTADSAYQLIPGLVEALREQSAIFVSHPGSRTARIALALARPGAESPGESVTRVQFYRHAIPHPELQYAVHDRTGRLLGISDFYWPEHRHLGEFDGKVKYERLLRPGEPSSDTVFREKRREDEMRADLRGMTRFVWADVMPRTARATMQRLHYELEQSRRLYVGGRSVIA
jgi:hypothetical protein